MAMGRFYRIYSLAAVSIGTACATVAYASGSMARQATASVGDIFHTVTVSIVSAVSALSALVRELFVVAFVPRRPLDCQAYEIVQFEQGRSRRRNFVARLLARQPAHLGIASARAFA